MYGLVTVFADSKVLLVRCEIFCLTRRLLQPHLTTDIDIAGHFHTVYDF